MTRNRILIGGGVAAVAVIAVVIFLVWWFQIRDDSPPAVTLEEAVSTVEEATPDATEPAAATATAGSATEHAAEAATEAASEAEAGPVTVDGTWVLADGDGSFVGYRVEEELATIGYKEAVGRTSTIEATITIADGRLTAVTVAADLRDLESDDSRRDQALQFQALESTRFPMATFELTEAVAVPEGLAEGEAISLEATGTLTLHGVTQPVTIPLEAELVDGVLAVVGSLPILFADYDIAQPRAPILVSIEDNGVMELQLLLVPGP